MQWDRERRDVRKLDTLLSAVFSPKNGMHGLHEMTYYVTQDCAKLDNECLNAFCVLETVEKVSSSVFVCVHDRSSSKEFQTRSLSFKIDSDHPWRDSSVLLC